MSSKRRLDEAEDEDEEYEDPKTYQNTLQNKRDPTETNYGLRPRGKKLREDGKKVVFSTDNPTYQIPNREQLKHAEEAEKAYQKLLKESQEYLKNFQDKKNEEPTEECNSNNSNRCTISGGKSKTRKSKSKKTRKTRKSKSKKTRKTSKSKSKKTRKTKKSIKSRK